MVYKIFKCLESALNCEDWLKRAYMKFIVKTIHYDLVMITNSM